MPCGAQAVNVQFEFPSQVCVVVFSDSWFAALPSTQDDANGGRQSQRQNALLAFKKRVSDIKHDVESDMEASANDYVCIAFPLIDILRRWLSTRATQSKR